MKVINLDYPFKSNSIEKGPIVLATGFFDGVHLGHQNVIINARRIAHAKQFPLAVLTFDRHPSTVFGKNNEKTYKYLSNAHRKTELFEQLDVDVVYVAKFNQALSSLSPDDFVNKFLVKLNIDTLVAGFDWTYGPKDTANMTTLRKSSQGDFHILKVPELKLAAQKIGSSRIRNFLKNHRLDESNEMLGYNYQNYGKVIYGDQRGRTLGFPTANLDIRDQQLVPGIGIYVTRVLVDKTWYPAMTSIGRDVTFKGDKNPITVEANLLGFKGDIYGKTVKIEWLEYLRGEIKFAGADELIKQLKTDQANTLKYFRKN